MSFSRKLVSELYKCSIFLFALQSLRPWFFWDSVVVYCIEAFALIMSCLLLHQSNVTWRIVSKYNFITFVILYFFLLYLNDLHSILGYIYISAKSFVYLVLLVYTSNSYKSDIWQFIMKWFSVLLGISIIAWIAYLLGVRWSYTLAEYGNYNFHNYGFFLFDVGGRGLNIRFSSIILEPGHLGTVLPLILFLNNYDFRKVYNILFLIAILFTLSLSGYVLLVVGYIFKALTNSTSKLFAVSFCVILLALLFVVAPNYNGGNNIVNQKISSRIDIKNNVEERSTSSMDLMYREVMNSDKIFFGLGNDYINRMTGGSAGNAGYRPFIVAHGMIGAVLTILLYCYYPATQRFKFKSLMFSMLYILSLMQRAYPWWDFFLMILLCGVPFFNTQISLSQKYGENVSIAKVSNI